MMSAWRNPVLGAWLGIAAALAVPQAGVAQDEQAPDNCLTCHGALDDQRLSAPARMFAADIHAVRGLRCVSCHGGDETAAGFEGMDPAKGFLAAPERGQVHEFCGRCHSDAQFMRQFNPSLRVDQVSEYVTSVHGQRLVELGDTLVATCTSCHPAHSIKPPSDPSSSVNPLRVAGTCSACHASADYMQSYGIPTDQRERYERSIHWEMMSVGGDLSAPTCNDCHGNHGAAPPGISWVGNVCGQCHSVMAENFSQSRHAQVFAMLGVPGCATCHNNHDIVRAGDELLGMGEAAVCSRCHSPDDRGGQTATSMRTLLDSLGAAFHAADSILTRAERAGMQVSEAQFDLSGANNAAVQARAAMHAFDLVAVRETVDEGLGITQLAHERGLDALDELSFRKTGLAISVVIILALIVGLVLRIRQLERRPA